MGYHLKITRELSPNRVGISLNEISAYFQESQDFKYLPETETWVWNGDGESCLWHTDEVVWTKNPSEDFIKYMIGMAASLNAIVRGDQGEYYRSIDDVFILENGKEISYVDYHNRMVAKNVKARRLKLLKWQFGLIVVMGVLVLLIKFVKSA